MSRRLVAALIGSALICGCGGSSTHTALVSPPVPVTQTTPTKAQFIASADAVCQSLRAQKTALKTEVEGVGTTFGKAAVVKLVRQALADAGAADTRIAALPKPPADAATIKKLLAGYAEEKSDLTEVADAYESGDVGARKSASAALKKVAESDRDIADGYGLKICGANPE